ncbi:MAG: N-methylproline demethylase, partial [Proteobacteria bacterium]|nr:N-methylproline demethylase [Pseudomonadota bacterium]
ERNVELSVDHELLAAHAEDKKTRVTLRNIHTTNTSDEFVDHLIVEAGTLPNDDLFYRLKDDSANKGIIDLDLFTEGRPQPAHGESFHLYRVGDVSGSRDIHCALLDSLRLCAQI